MQYLKNLGHWSQLGAIRKLPALRTIRQKALPKRKTKRKFSRKQLAAQRLFAKRARAGTLRR